MSPGKLLAVTHFLLGLWRGGKLKANTETKTGVPPLHFRRKQACRAGVAFCVQPEEFFPTAAKRKTPLEIVASVAAVTLFRESCVS